LPEIRMDDEPVKKTRRPGGGRKRDPHTANIQTRLGVKERQARNLKKRGVTAENLDTIESAKLAKLIVGIELDREKLAILQRAHIPAAKVREDGLAAFAVVRQAIVAQEVQLPPLLEGLTAKEMRTVIAGHGERMLKDLSERIAAIA
jgi:hypothetical protein